MAWHRPEPHLLRPLCTMGFYSCQTHESDPRSHTRGCLEVARRRSSFCLLHDGLRVGSWRGSRT
eukprot:3686430-Prymnesium_polylepis.1